MARSKSFDNINVSWLDLNAPIDSLRKRLKLLVDPIPGYAEYLMNSLPKNSVKALGVRTPPIRQTVKEIRAIDGIGFLNAVLKTNIATHKLGAPKRKNKPGDKKETNLDYYEERIAIALLIGQLNLTFDQRIEAITAFLPFVDSWAVCDTLCGEYKPKQSERDDLWNYIGILLDSKRPYDQRVGLVLMVKYYTAQDSVSEALERVDSLARKGFIDHTVSSASSWLVCEAFIKRPEIAIRYLEENTLDDRTFNRTIDRICESLRVDKEAKKEIFAMRRQSSAKKNRQ